MGRDGGAPPSGAGGRRESAVTPLTTSRHPAGPLGRPRLWWTLFCVLTFLPVLYPVVKQVRETAAVRAYLSSEGLLGAPVTWETAIAVSQALRADFEVREERWTRLDLSDRPFLRHDTKWLLDAREGLCGEGTRVLVNLLDELGFDATRISLFDRFLRSEHTLASVVIDGRERFIDSINSTPPVNAFLNANPISTADFPLTHYSEDLVERMALGDAVSNSGHPREADYPRFFEKFRLYSYEAIPASKLAARLAIDWRIFNLSRPGRLVSRLAEKPHAIEAVVLAAVALCLNGLVATALAIRRRIGRSEGTV